MTKSGIRGIDPKLNFVVGDTLPTENAGVLNRLNNKLDILKDKILLLI